MDVDTLRRLRVRLVVAFGSRARGVPGPEADLDLGVLFEPGRTPADPTVVLQGLRIAGQVDVSCLDDGDPLLLFEVARDGLPLFEALPGAFEEFRLRAVKRYLDTAWIRDVEAEALRARLG